MKYLFFILLMVMTLNVYSEFGTPWAGVGGTQIGNMHFDLNGKYIGYESGNQFIGFESKYNGYKNGNAYFQNGKYIGKIVGNTFYSSEFLKVSLGAVPLELSTPQNKTYKSYDDVWDGYLKKEKEYYKNFNNPNKAEDDYYQQEKEYYKNW